MKGWNFRDTSCFGGFVLIGVLLVGLIMSVIFCKMGENEKERNLQQEILSLGYRSGDVELYSSLSGFSLEEIVGSKILQNELKNFIKGEPLTLEKTSRSGSCDNKEKGGGIGVGSVVGGMILGNAIMGD